MKEDPIIKEVRDAGRKIELINDNDFNKVINYLKENEKENNLIGKNSPKDSLQEKNIKISK